MSDVHVPRVCMIVSVRTATEWICSNTRNKISNSFSLINILSSDSSKQKVIRSSKSPPLTTDLRQKSVCFRWNLSWLSIELFIHWYWRPHLFSSLSISSTLAKDTGKTFRCRRCSSRIDRVPRRILVLHQNLKSNSMRILFFCIWSDNHWRKVLPRSSIRSIVTPSRRLQFEWSFRTIFEVHEPSDKFDRPRLVVQQSSSAANESNISFEKDGFHHQ